MAGEWVLLGALVLAVLGMGYTATNNITAWRQARDDLAYQRQRKLNGSLLLLRQNVVAAELQRVCLILTMLAAVLAAGPLLAYLPLNHLSTWLVVGLSLAAVAQMATNTRRNLRQRAKLLAKLEQEQAPWDGVTERRQRP